MIDSLLMAVHAFVNRVLMSISAVLVARHDDDDLTRR